MNRGNYGVLQRYAVLQRAVQHADVVIGNAGAHDGGDEHPDPNYPAYHERFRVPAGAGECRVSQEAQGRTPAQLLSLKEQTSEPLHQYQRQGNGLYHEK